MTEARHTERGADDPVLSDRELEVMRLLAKGMSNASIGAELYIGVETVKSHLSGIYRKLDVSSRGQAVAWLNDRPALAVDPDAPIASTTTSEIPGGVRVVLAGEFDLTAMQLLSDALEAARAASTGAVELDMEQVAFIDSSALRVLVGFITREPKIPVRIVNPSPSVTRVVEFAGLKGPFGLAD
mgnify:FL=1